MTSRRDTLKAVALLAVADKLGDGGLARIVPQGVPQRPVEVLPPGALDSESFRSKCIACGVCMAVCPEKIIKPSVKMENFGQPVLDFRNGHCLLSCIKCTEVCPVGAIAPLQREMKINTHIGHAIWKKDLCVRTVNSDECTACVRKCPVQAVKIVQGFPVIDRGKCIGCGACEHVCPARPRPAIFVKGFKMQRVVKPIAERDLVAEMKVVLDSGFSVVTARDGVIIDRCEGRGIAPLMKLMDANRIGGTIVYDRIIGRAAAAICVVGKVRKVYASVMSDGAKALLEANGIPAFAETMTSQIINREKSGPCPMEKAVKDLDNPENMVKTLRKAIEK